MSLVEDHDENFWLGGAGGVGCLYYINTKGTFVNGTTKDLGSKNTNAHQYLVHSTLRKSASPYMERCSK